MAPHLVHGLLLSIEEQMVCYLDSLSTCSLDLGIEQTLVELEI